MNSIIQKMQADVGQAMRDQDKAKLNILRFALSELKNSEISKGRPITNSEAFQILHKIVKTGQEAEEQYRQIGALDEAEREKSQYEMLSNYLPSMLNGDELRKLIESAISELDAKDLSMFGQVMKKVMKKAQGRADGKQISEMIKSILSS